MTFAEFQTRLQESIDWLAKEYVGIRTGQATPALLDNVKVESYGTTVPLNQVASVGIEDARTLRISPWDAGVIGSIERSLIDADLGISVATDSSGLRVIFPELTSERRAQLTKLAKQKLEDARVSIRAARDEIMKAIDHQEKSGDISEDDKFAERDRVQKAVEATNQKLDTQYEAKEAEMAK